MTQTQSRSLLATGALLMAVPGVFTDELRILAIACQGAGFVVLSTVAIKDRACPIRSALQLLAASNLAFWACYGLLLVRWRWIDPSGPFAGVDIFAGTAALWLLLLLPFLLFEAAMVIRAARTNHQLKLALLVGLLALAQIPSSMRFAWVIVEGV
jgi:hypothetical protein